MSFRFNKITVYVFQYIIVNGICKQNMLFHLVYLPEVN